MSASRASQPLRVALAGAVRVVGERRREVRVGVAMALPVIVLMAVRVIMMIVVAMRMVVVMIVVVVMAVMMAVSIMIMVILSMIVIMPMPQPGADAFHVMVVALLHAPDLGLVADRLLAVFAQLAVHRVVAGEDLAHPLGEGVQHQWVVVEVARL